MIAKATITPGIYRNMPDEEYRAIEAVSKSDLDKWSLGRDIDERTALIGTVFHAAILEPEKAREMIAVAVRETLHANGSKDKTPIRRNSNEWSDFCSDRPDKWVLTSGEYKKIVGMVESIKEHPQLGKLREMARADASRCELVVVWVDDATGVLCKAKIDQVTDKYAWDWKSTGSDPDDFAKSIGAFGYHIQASHYLTGAKACGIEVEAFRFACSSKRADKQHVCWVQDIDEAMMLAGLRTREMLLRLFARYNPNHPAVTTKEGAA